MMDEKRFKELLLIYGADMKRWPEEARQEGIHALSRSSACLEAMERELEFENLLRLRRLEEHGEDFPERIISAATRKHGKKPSPMGAFFTDLFAEVGLSRMAAATLCALMLFVLITGFTIGYVDPLESSAGSAEQVSMGEFLYSQGEVI